MKSLAPADARRVEISEQHVSQCMRWLRQAAVALDRVRGEPGDEDERQLVEGALRLTDTV